MLKYRKYVQEEGFKHRKVTLEWSEANGDVERHMQRIKKTATATLQLLLYQLTNEIAHQGFWIYSWLKTITWFWRWLSNRLSRRHPDNHFQSRYVPPGFKPFSYNELCNIVPVCLQNFFDAIFQKRRRVLHHGFQTLRNSWKHDAEGGVLLSLRCVWNPWWNTNPELLTCLLYWNNETFWNHRSSQLYMFSLYGKNTFNLHAWWIVFSV